MYLIQLQKQGGELESLGAKELTESEAQMARSICHAVAMLYICESQARTRMMEKKQKPNLMLIQRLLMKCRERQYKRWNGAENSIVGVQKSESLGRSN